MNDDVAFRLTQCGLNPAGYHLADIAHDVRDSYPQGRRPTTAGFLAIARHNERTPQ